MDQRERFLKVINRQLPDRPPTFVTLTPQMAGKLSDATGLPYEEPIDSLLSTRISHTKLLTALGNDCVGIAAAAPKDRPTRTREDGTKVNEWGMIFKSTGLYDEFYEYPLASAESVEDIETYDFPDPHAEGRFDHAVGTVEEYASRYGIIADLETSFFETSWYLTGLEKFLMDMMMGTPYVEALLDRVMQINTETGIELIRIGADMIWCGDDFGGQSGMLIDPEVWRVLFKPRIRQMFEAFRKVNPDIKIAWHSCGSIIPIIPDFIEIGLDVLNPLQPLAKDMTPEKLKNEFGKDLIFFGGIDVQDLLPNATPGQVKEEVKRRMDIFGEGGGYIVAPAHNIQPDTPVENVMAYYEAIREYAY
jgi:uroporphyrinogen decarboxylase